MHGFTVKVYKFQALVGHWRDERKAWTALFLVDVQKAGMVSLQSNLTIVVR